MTYGPIDFIALEFKGNKFTGEGMAALLDLVANRIIRVIDLVIVSKDQDGNITAHEVRQDHPDVIQIFNPLGAEVSEMIKVADLEMVGEKLGVNSTAAVMLFENLWAITFKEALLKAGGELVMFERIPHEVVLEAVEDLSLADSTVE